MGPRADLDMCGKSRHHQDSIPGPSSLYPVATLTDLPGPRLVRKGTIAMRYRVSDLDLDRCSWPRPGTGSWHQLYRAARGSAGMCHFSFLDNFHEEMFYSGNILKRIIFVNVTKNSDPDVGLRKLQYATRFH